MTGTARKARIVEAASDDGYSSEVARSIDNMADATRTLAGVVASAAAANHSRDYADQRNMAMVIFEDAMTRFKELERKIEPRRKAELDAYVAGLVKRK